MHSTVVLFAALLAGTLAPDAALGAEPSRARASTEAPSRMQQTLAAQGASGRRDETSAWPAHLIRRMDVAGVAPRPDVFGSVALPVSRTPLDARWRAAGAASPAGLNQWASAFARVRGANAEILLGDVNQWVNARLAFSDDRARGVADSWAGAAEALSRGRGDCEDYALAKMQILTALGFDPRRLYLVIVQDLARRVDHAVLVAEVGRRYLVLDNLTDAVLNSNDVRGYAPIISYSAAGRWVHGYERAPAQPPVRIARLGSETGR